MTDLHTRDFKLRALAAAGEASRTVTGLAVPYDDEIELMPGYFETVAPGAFRAPAEDSTGIKLLWRHDEPIGRVTTVRETDAGLEIDAHISATARGDEVYELLRDGVVDRFSIGFVPIESEETRDAAGATHSRLTAIEVREVSVVPWSAYEHATVTAVRTAHTTTAPEEAPTMTETITDLTAIREDIADVRRDLDFLRCGADTSEPAPTDHRTAGAFLKDIVREDEATLRSYEGLVTRAWAGTTTAADSTMDTPTWIGDLTRLFNQPDPLKALFSTGPLPAEGMNLEYTQLNTNTIQVAEQTAEGADLVTGKLSTKDATAPVKTFGGYTSLSRQSIERTRINILDRHLTGMALAAGAASAKTFAATYATAVKAQASSALSSTKAASALAWADLAGLVVDAAAAFIDQALALDGLIVDTATFKALASLTGSDGRPLMSVSGTGANTAGTMNLPSLTGNLVGLTVTPNLRQKSNDLGTGVVGAFYNTLALRVYETSLVQLQDENIINLTKAFSVYRYGAIAVEMPTALVPLKLGAAA